MRRILFSADGSGGDLMPMVLMAREFQRAGYEVCVCGASDFSSLAQDFGVPFEGYPHSYAELYLDRMRLGYTSNVYETMRHWSMLFQGEYEVLSKLAPQYDVLVNFLGELFVPSVAEAFGLPNVKLLTFPVTKSGSYGTPAGLPFTTDLRWLNRLQWELAGFAANHVLPYRSTVNRLRAQLGLAPLRDLLAANARCDHMMIGLYEELLPPCPDWADIDYSYIGPCLPSDPVALSPELERFLAAGPKPVYIGFGSMRHRESERLTRILVEAVEAVGLRAILAQATSSIGSGLRESERIFVLREYPIPHHVLFPRLAAAVHHGSWITTHLAARAGIPQLVLPQASDQYMWADRVAKCGLGPPGVHMNRLRAGPLGRALEQLVGRAEHAARARALAQRVRGIDGPQNAVRLFEAIAGGLRARSGA